jgi:riboflavin kinase/FMN adenylyltransferase
MNIGFKPSVENKNIRTIEIHLFNFDKDIYDALINVQAVSKLRDEIKFPNLDKLKKQISNDIVHAKSILENTID